MKNSRKKQADQLHRLKTLRFKASQNRHYTAQRVLANAINVSDEAEIAYRSTVDNAGALRLERLQDIFASTTEHASLQSVAVGTWLRTEQEMDIALVDLNLAREDVEEASDRLKLAQIELAQKMRGEKKTEKLCRFEAEKIRREQLRQS